MRIEQKVTVDAPRHLVWEYVTEPANYPVFMEGLTRWEVAGDHHTGLGARYRMLIRVGAADVGGLIEIVEWQPEGDMAWSSVTGVGQRGRWRLRELADGRTRVTFRFAYGVAGGGLAGLIAERVAAPSLSRRFRLSLLNLKKAGLRCRQPPARRFALRMHFFRFFPFGNFFLQRLIAAARSKVPAGTRWRSGRRAHPARRRRR